MLITMILAAFVALTTHRRSRRRPTSIRVHRALRLALRGVLA